MCELVRFLHFGSPLCVHDEATVRNQLVNRKRGARRNECAELARKGRHGEISLCQNQFPRPRVHFISQRADSGTHATAWLGLWPSSHWCPPLLSFLSLCPGTNGPRAAALSQSDFSLWSKWNIPVVIPVNDQHALVRLKLYFSRHFIADLDRDRLTASLIFLLCRSDLLTETFIPFIHLVLLWGLSQSLNREALSLALEFLQEYIKFFDYGVGPSPWCHS